MDRKEASLIESQSYKELQNWYENCKITGEDIHEHLDTLLEYAKKSESIVELGVRKIISSIPFALGLPKKLTSVDIYMPSYFLHDNEQTLDYLRKLCKDLNIDFQFILGNDLEIELEPVDFLFIDTNHTYDQLTKELKLHSNKVKKWIALHDTTAYADYLTVDGRLEGGLKFAINEFLQANSEWKIEAEYTNNNGLTILSRI